MTIQSNGKSSINKSTTAIQTQQNGNKSIVSLSTAKLDVTKVPKLVGAGPRERVSEIFSVLENTNIPLYLVGNSGSGKTLAMKTLLKSYSKKHGVPCYYFQLSQEDTKTSVLMGPRLVNGSLVMVDGVLAQAAEENAIVGIDEITHSTFQMLLMLNSIDGGESIISTGDREIDASGMKIIYGSNRSNHAGNIRVPQSFANRVVTFNFDYPSFEDEVIISKATAARKFTSGTLSVPDSMYKYVASFVLKNRTEEWPLSSRNIANVAVLCEIATNLEKRKIEKLREENPLYKKQEVDSYFVSSTNVESLRRTITESIIGKPINDVSVMQKPEIMDFVKYVSFIGVEKFREIVKISVNFYADMEGQEYTGSQMQKILTSII